MNIKNLFIGMLTCSLLLTFTANAQFRKIPGIVTDSFKIKYPSAQNVSWSDKITVFQASFNLDKAEYTAKYNKQGEWQGSEKKITVDEVPAAVKDGLSKSKYVDWPTKSAVVRYLPGNQTQYAITVAKNDFQRRTLVFNVEGRLIKD